MTEPPLVSAQVVMRRADGRSLLDIEGPITATSPDRTAGDLDPARIERITARLTEAGFTVAAGTPGTLSVTAPPAVFARVFGLSGPTGTAVQKARVPADLEPFVADVFVTPPPTFFP